MNHPSEWAKYFDAPKGIFRYKHKGTGVVRDTLMNIGKRFKNQTKKERARQVLKRVMENESKQILKTAADKATEKAAEKGAEKIQAVLRGEQGSKNTAGVRGATQLPTPRSTLSTESRQKLNKILKTSAVPHPKSKNPVVVKLSGDSRKKLKQILDLGRAAKLKVNQYLAEN